MKRILNLALCLFAGFIAFAQLPKLPFELTINQQIEDYDFAVKYIEDNYSGIPYWVVDTTRADYEATKARLTDNIDEWVIWVAERLEN
jgi:hypothetical protein